MNSNVISEADQQDKMNKPMEDPILNVDPQMEMDEDDEVVDLLSKGATFRRPFSRSDATKLKEAWPAVESALEEVGMECELDLDQYFITFSYTHYTLQVKRAPLKARILLQLLSARVPPRSALRVLEVPYDIIYTGYYKRRGLCSKFGIKRDEYLKRKKHLMSFPAQEVANLTGCEIFVCPKRDLVAAIGGSVQGLKLVRWIVSDCIVRNVPPRVRWAKNYLQMFRGLQKLRI